MVFLFVLFVFIIYVILIIFSKIIIEIKDLQYSSQKNNKEVNSNYKIIIKLKVFNKISILKTVYDKKKLDKINKKLKINNKIKNIDFQNIIDKVKGNNKLKVNIIKKILKDMFDIIYINLSLELGTQNAATTAIIVGIISTIISIVLSAKIKNNQNQEFKITPIYANQDIININISGIFGIKVIHIISIIYILIKEKSFTKQLSFAN